MPQFRTLSPEEVAQLTGRRVNLADLAPYLDYLEWLKVGDYGEVTVEHDESREAVKRRTTVAAKQLGLAIEWWRSPDENKLVFEVVPVADEGLIDRAGKMPEQDHEAGDLEESQSLL